jgi:hypothetical protein
VATKYYTERGPHAVVTREQGFSVASILAIICAIASFFTGAMLGVGLAIAAIVLGLIGAVSALGPGTRGGVVSMMSIFAGVAGVVAAAFKLIAYFF